MEVRLRLGHLLRVFGFLAAALTLAAPLPAQSPVEEPASGSQPIEGWRGRIVPLAGLHAGPSQRVAVTSGLVVERAREDGCPDTAAAPRSRGCWRGGPVGLLLASPGLRGLRVSVGGGWLSESMSGATLTLSALRTWGARGQVEANQTYLGPGVNVLVSVVNVGFAAYVRIAGDAPDEEWFATVSFGIGL